MKIFKNFNQKINYKFQNFNFNNKKIYNNNKNKIIINNKKIYNNKKIIFNNKKIYNNNNNKINIKYNKNKFRICNKKINKKSLILNIYNFNIKN